MKISQLPNGARFEYEGAEYVKTGPLFATGLGGPRLIPKYAVLKPLGEASAATAEDHATLVAKEAVLNAFNAFFAECKAITSEDQRSALEDARDRYLNALDGAAQDKGAKKSRL